MQEQTLGLMHFWQAGDAVTHFVAYLLLWASVHGLVSLACRPTIVAIRPEVARVYIGELVDAGFRAFPIG